MYMKNIKQTNTTTMNANATIVNKTKTARDGHILIMTIRSTARAWPPTQLYRQSRLSRALLILLIRIVITIIMINSIMIIMMI